MKKLGKVILFLLFFAMTVYGAKELFAIRQEYAFSEEQYDAIAEQYVVTVTAPTEETAETGPTEPKEYAPIQVDFEKLRLEGDEIIGWLYSEDTVINYPVVHCDNNDYYLNRLPNGTYSGGGTIFMDYRNSGDMSDWNSILYGHNMNDDSMFGTLSDYRRQEYADEHSVMYFLMPDQDYKIEIIGGYTTRATSDAYVIPGDLDGRDTLAEMAVKYSEFTPTWTSQEGDRLITLSTCTYEYDHARFILVGVLRELDRRETEPVQ